MDGPGGARTNDWTRVWLMMFETGMNHFVVSYFVKWLFVVLRMVRTKPASRERGFR